MASPLRRHRGLPGGFGGLAGPAGPGGHLRGALGDGAITTASLRIPEERVLRWTLGGRGSQANDGLGLAGNVLGALPGLLGLPGVPILPGLNGSGTVHNDRFAIHDIGGDGKSRVSSIRFVNNLPAQQFMAERTGLAQLSLGQRAEASERQRLETLPCGATLKPYACRWSRHLEANPTIRFWSEANPRLVPAQKALLGAAD